MGSVQDVFSVVGVYEVNGEVFICSVQWAYRALYKSVCALYGKYIVNVCVNVW